MDVLKTTFTLPLIRGMVWLQEQNSRSLSLIECKPRDINCFFLDYFIHSCRQKQRFSFFTALCAFHLPHTSYELIHTTDFIIYLILAAIYRTQSPSQLEQRAFMPEVVL